MRTEAVIHSLASVLLFAASLLVTGCAVQGVSGSPEAEAELEALSGRTCGGRIGCPEPAAPCRQCADGSYACPAVDCIKDRCVYSFSKCPLPSAPCVGKSCGESCSGCSPSAGRPCPDVVSYCQPDGSCAAQRPSCTDEDFCATAHCPVGTQCLVKPTHPPTVSCEPVDKCATVRCATGTHCEAGACTADAPKVFCGGIAGIACPGAGTCIDDPSDSCDPMHGGADCGGLCVCKQTQPCLIGAHWDASPTVCACRRDGGGTCGSNTCGAGQYCCNPLCGICTARGVPCPQAACDTAL